VHTICGGFSFEHEDQVGSRWPPAAVYKSTVSGVIAGR
jgi:hypothetical protein